MAHASGRVRGGCVFNGLLIVLATSGMIAAAFKTATEVF